MVSDVGRGGVVEWFACDVFCTQIAEFDGPSGILAFRFCRAKKPVDDQTKPVSELESWLAFHSTQPVEKREMPSEETKERITKVVDVARTVIHYGWIPLIIYIGYTRSSPQPTVIKLLSPLA